MSLHLISVNGKGKKTKKEKQINKQTEGILVFQNISELENPFKILQKASSRMNAPKFSQPSLNLQARVLILNHITVWPLIVYLLFTAASSIEQISHPWRC